MGTRLLTDGEKDSIRARLKVALEYQKSLGDYIANLEQQLHDGTTWCYESIAFKKMCKEVDEKVATWRKQAEEREVARYGRLLTDAERRGWVARPDELKKNKEDGND